MPAAYVAKKQALRAVSSAAKRGLSCRGDSIAMLYYGSSFLEDGDVVNFISSDIV